MIYLSIQKGFLLQEKRSHKYVVLTFTYFFLKSLTFIVLYFLTARNLSWFLDIYGFFWSFFFKFIYYLLFNRFEEKIHVLVSVLEFIRFFVGFFMNRKKRLFIWFSRQINPRQSGIVFKIGFLKNVVFLLMPRNVRRNK